MNWINDVRKELQQLDLSKKSLRKFGLIVGAVFVLLTLWLTFKNYHPTLRYILGTIGILLIVFGIFLPKVLKGIYLFWIGIALAIGWVISRILLIILYYVVLTPIGLIGRSIGKEFLDIKPKYKETYWIKKNSSAKTNYDKMF